MKQPNKPQVQITRIKRGGNRSTKGITAQDKFNFLVEEYRMLRTEIESYSKQKRQLEVSVITAILVIYGWIGTVKPSRNLETVALAAPTLMVLWGIYRSVFYNRTIMKEVKYVKERIERVIMGSEGGWETFWESTGTWGILKRTEYLFWLVAFLITLRLDRKIIFLVCGYGCAG